MRDLSPVLASSIARVAAPNDLCYTEQQLYYEVCRTVRPLPSLTVRQGIGALGVGVLAAAWSWWTRQRAAGVVGVLSLGVSTLAAARRLPFTLPPPIPYARFAEALQRYTARCGAPPGLLLTSRPAPLALAGRELDLTDYGLPRLLVCQDASIAAMLLANRLHMELSCAILALEEASPLPAYVAAMLARTPTARVYFLHDASAPGLALVPGLVTRLSLPSGLRPTSIGLRPQDAWRLHLFAQRGEPIAEHGWPTYLSRSERRWLAQGWRADAHAVRPARLVRALRRALLGAPTGPRRPLSLKHLETSGFMT